MSDLNTITPAEVEESPSKFTVKNVCIVIGCIALAAVVVVGGKILFGGTASPEVPVE